MPPTRPHPSATLPRNFHFHYHDDEAPKTPEPQEPRNFFDCPPPPRQAPRRPRTRLGIPSFSPPRAVAALQDIPIPTIEQPIPEPVVAPRAHHVSPPNS